MSDLASTLERYLEMRRGFGFKLQTQETRLRSFVAYMGAHGAAIITNRLAAD